MAARLAPAFTLGTLSCARAIFGTRGSRTVRWGVLVEVTENRDTELLSSLAEDEPALGWVLWDDGERRPVTEAMLDDLELTYAITVHKAQGSQWARVIIPVTGSRLLDRTLVYTAMTRATGQVLLVGDAESVRQATERPPRVRERCVGLGLELTARLRLRTSPQTQ